MEILHNSWYMFAWDSELIEHTRLVRVVAGEAISVERLDNGGVSARSDAPGRRAIAAELKHHIIWIWLGSYADGDPSAIPDFNCFDNVKETAFFGGCIYTNANYELVIDNILDLSHADYLHPNTLGGMMTHAVPTLERDGDIIKMTWDSPDGLAPPILDSLLPEPGKPAHVRISVRWQPASVIQLRFDMAPAGEPLDKWFSSNVAHIMTPESQYKTHYFYGGDRNYRADDPATNYYQSKAIRAAFISEDKPMVEAQQREIGEVDFWDLKPALLTIDRGAIMARRRLAQLIREEAKKAQAQHAISA